MNEMSNQRLLDVFHTTSNDFYLSALNLNQKSLYWQEQNRNKKWTIDNLINFRQENNLSHGLDDAKLNSGHLKQIWGKIVEVISEEVVLSSFFNTKNIGNSLSCFEYKGKIIDPHKAFQIMWYLLLKDNISGELNILCEIGGGFGSFSELIMKNNNKIKLLSIDLPESNLLTAYYLSASFPSKRFYLYDDYSKENFLSYKDFYNNDIIILPPNCNIDRDIKFDLFINTRSMMEMNFDVISSYFDFIHKHISNSGYFLNVNRFRKKIADKTIRFCDYPYDEKWDTVCSCLAPFQGHMKYLITQRCFDPNKQNIKRELELILKKTISIESLEDKDKDDSPPKP